MGGGGDFWWKPCVEWSVRISERRLRDTVVMNVKEVGREDVNWIELAR
jgi:hypothetical protein